MTTDCRFLTKLVTVMASKAQTPVNKTNNKTMAMAGKTPLQLLATKTMETNPYQYHQNDSRKNYGNGRQNAAPATGYQNHGKRTVTSKRWIKYDKTTN